MSTLAVAAPVRTANPPRPRRQRHNRTVQQQLTHMAVWLVAAVAIIGSIMPVVYVWIGGFRGTADINKNPGGLPDPLTLKNYAMVFTSKLFWGSLTSSLVIGLGTTIGVALLGVMAAFVIARYNFAGRRALYALFTAGLMFPMTVASLPLSILIRNLHLAGNFFGIILPQIAFALPTTIIILVPFLRAIPDELEEAAALDGTTRIGFFWRIMLPLSMPGIITVGVLAFIGSWNAYLLPLLVMAAGGLPQQWWTLPLGAVQFSSQYTADTGAQLAYTAVSMVPALLFFLIAEKRIVGGLAGAVKG